jgi:hypothetical protein
MNTENIQRGTILIPRGCPASVGMGSAIQCLSADEKGFRFRRMNLNYGGEEFFLTRQAIETSQWDYSPENSQLRFL